ncbi:MAG TPA: cytochrome b N-terminal domain-containing protein [Candidatus Paceibacterota bacterium]|nr:cytochrome b N-terminal domain-containing protein [Candidatus Paceibacterota bacterium]
MEQSLGAQADAGKRGLSAWFKNQLALAPLIGEYYVPEETNNFWYSLGGVLAISLALQGLSGIILTLKYIPDAALAFGVVSQMLNSRFWGIVLSFHYFNSFLIYGLVMAHLMRVFVSAAYRNQKKVLWFVGVILAALVFATYLTGEALHWDEVGFAVPWNISEFLQLVHLNNVLHYNFSDLLAPATATTKLVQLYAMHIAILPFFIILFVGLHFYLIRMKGISLPFWKKPSGNKVPFTSHVKLWFAYAGLMTGAVLLLAVFVGRSAGTSPQLLPSSPLYQTSDDAGGLGFKPTLPIGWTKGMNELAAQSGIDPDIWGTITAMILMLGSLLVIPFVDRGESEPASFKEAFSWRTRKWAFLAIALFWAVMIAGIVQNFLVASG